MKEADYTLKKEVLRFPVYSVGTNDEGTRERERERKSDSSRYIPLRWRKGYENRSNFWENGLQRIELVNKLSETRYSYIIST